MEALTFDARSRILKYSNNAEIPRLEKDNDVIVRVHYAGVCGTDLHIIQGSFPCSDRGPFIMGHEFCGTVQAAGPEAAFSPGQRVVVDPNGGCGTCRLCHSGSYHMCEIGGINTTIGIWTDGGWAQYCRAPDTQISILPDSVSFAAGALCEPLSCLARGWDRAGQMPIGIDILILGAGIIGNLWATLFHLQGHKNVTISEPNMTRLNTSKTMGFGYTYKQPNEVASSGQLFDVIVDCTGVAKAMTDAIKLLNKSGRYVLFGCSNPKDTAEINPFEMYLKEATIVAVNINPFTFPKAIGLLQSMGDKYTDYMKLGIGQFQLKDYEEAFNQLKTGAISKAIFKL